MAWGGKDNAVERWIKQLKENDPSLTTLHIFSMRRLSQADLKAIFAAIASNTTLKELYCSGHKLEKNTMDQLAETLTLNDTLTSLNIGTSELGKDLELIKILAEGLAANEGLERLDLENKALDSQCMAILAPALAANKTLSWLNVSRNELDDEAIAHLAKALGDQHHLGHLNLASNRLSAAGLQSLANCLAGLQELDLSDNTLAEGAGVIGSALKGNTSLHTLKMVDVTGNTPAHGNQLVTGIALALTNNKVLKCLWLNNNAIESGAMEQLVQALPGSALTELHIRQNRLDDAAAHWFAKGSHPLQKLELSGNAVGFQGFGALLGASLQHLGLFGNKIGGFPELLPDLHSSGIASLDIGCNNLTLQDVQALIAALENGGLPKLVLLEMGGNVKQEEIETWEPVIERLSVARPEIDVVWKLSLQPQQ